MENQKKKLRLEDIKVESFVTANLQNPDTLKGGSEYSACACTRSAPPCLCTHGCPDETAPNPSGYNTVPCNCS